MAFQHRGLGKFRLKTLFMILIAGVMGGYIIFGWWTWSVMHQVEVNGPEYQRVILGKDLIADILPPPKYIIESYLITLQLERANNNNEQEALITRLQQLRAEYIERQRFWLGANLAPDLKNAMTKTTHDPAMRYYAILFDRFIPAVKQNNIAVREQALREMHAAYQLHRNAVDDLVNKTNASNTQVEKETERHIQHGRLGMILIWLLALLSVGSFTVLLARYLLSVLGGDPRDAMEVVHAISQNDLQSTIILRAGDEQSLLAAIDSMRHHLNDVLREVSAAASGLSTASQRLKRTSQQVSLSSNEQSEAVMSMASAMEEVAVGISHITENAENAHDLAHKSHQHSSEGIELAQGASEHMHSLQDSVAASADKITALQISSALIRQAAETIRNIADQTNLLALNAAIEAARAGEAGRGFAVVADEVRKLAENTTQATSEIDHMIQAIHQDMGEAINTMDKGVNLVSQGVKISQVLGESMYCLAQESDQVAKSVSEISVSLRQQTTAHEQVISNVSTIARMSEANSGEVQRIATAAEKLSELAQRLHGTVSIFQLG